VVGASGFEPPTSWSRTLGRPILQAIAWLCNLPIPCSFRHFLNHFQTFRLAQGCTELSPLVTRKGQEKGKLTQVLDSRFTHHYRPPASHCDRTSQVRRRAWTSDQERLVFHRRWITHWPEVSYFRFPLASHPEHPIAGIQNPPIDRSSPFAASLSSDRRGQEFRCQHAGPKKLATRDIRRSLHASWRAVSRSDDGARRWYPAPSVGCW